MTDEQIIRAADICRTGKCNGCPYHELYTAGCVGFLMKDALDLINRQKAEIERLQTRNDELNILNKTAAQEAIKEFAERLKKHILDLDFRPKTSKKTVPTAELKTSCNWILHEVVPQEIDDLVEEMTEVEK